MTEIVKSEVQSFGKEHLNNLQNNIRDTVKRAGYIYKADKDERRYLNNLFRGQFEQFRKDFFPNTPTEQVVLYILKGSFEHKFWKGKLFNAVTIWKHYAQVYNSLKTDYENIQSDTLDLSYGTTHFSIPQDGVRYIIITIKSGKEDKQFWIRQSDEEKIKFAKNNGMLVKALGGGEFHPKFIVTKESYYKASTPALPYKPKKLTKTDLKKRAKTTDKLRKLREKKKQVLEKEIYSQAIEQKYPDLSTALDMGGDTEKELLNKLKK